MILPPNTHPSSSPQTLATVTYSISQLPPKSPPCGGRLQFFIGAWSGITQDKWFGDTNWISTATLPYADPYVPIWP